MPKRRIGLLTFSDGREAAHQARSPVNLRFHDRVVQTLEGTGEVEVLAASCLIHTPEEAVSEAKRLVAADVDGTILNYSIWSFPHLSAIAANLGRAPYLLLCNINPQYPGLVGMLAAAGALEQIGIKHRRVWGDIQDPAVLGKVMAFCRAANVIHTLRGQTYGEIGGRAMGMYTAVSDPAQWQKLFGVDADHIDQLEVVRLGNLVPDEVVERAYAWLHSQLKEIVFSGAFTEDALRRQIRHYYAVKELVRDRKLDFCGIKCQPELSGHYSTACLVQAFLNDPYDMDGPKEPVVCSCEVDMDGALTMQMLKLITGKPVLFMDFRHFDAQDGVFVFCNCGSQSSWYAAASDNCSDNLCRVSMHAQVRETFPSGGGTIAYECKPGPVTLARLMRRDGKYWMAILTGEFVPGRRELTEQTSPHWPHAFVRLGISADKLIESYACNHIHAVYGDVTRELECICDFLGIEAVNYATKV